MVKIPQVTISKRPLNAPHDTAKFYHEQ